MVRSLSDEVAHSMFIPEDGRDAPESSEDILFANTGSRRREEGVVFHEMTPGEEGKLRNVFQFNKSGNHDSMHM